MSMTNTENFPQQHDEKLAGLYYNLDAAQRRIAAAAWRIMSVAGYKRIYFGRTASSQDWARVTTTSGDHWDHERVTLDEGIARLSEMEHAAASVALAQYEQEQAVAEATEDAIEEAELEYTGWSRFFLVTSSQGHIHSSMRCSTCRLTTQYGWMPELSGKDEAEAVEACGPTLCSICFPSAPVDWQDGKISKKDAERLAWSPDRDEKLAKKEADRQAKEQAKAKKAASKLKYDESLAHKVNTLFDLSCGPDCNSVYEWTWENKGYDNAYFIYADMIGRNA